jgi:3-oxoacyl-[acyl-carrier protein] reductase
VDIQGKVAVVTGAASGIGRAVALELAQRGARTVAMIDRTDCVSSAAADVKQLVGRDVGVAFHGDVTDAAFRRHVFDSVQSSNGGVSICVPAAGITRDALAVRIDKTSGRAEIYPEATFRQVLDVNMVAPIYWVLEMVARIAEQRYGAGLRRWQPSEDDQGVGVLIGSVSSLGNKGQISYATTKAGLEGAAATLMTEAIFHGVRCAVIHPGYTDTPMVRALGEDFIEHNILPYTQLGRLIRPEEIADAICFMIQNSAMSHELWVDAGWHPPA